MKGGMIRKKLKSGHKPFMYQVSLKTAQDFIYAE